MANYLLEVPAPNVSTFDVINFNDTLNTVKNRYNMFSNLINKSAETSNIDKKILVGVCYSLTGIGQIMGDSIGNSNGLMLWNRIFAPNFIKTEFLLGRLSEQEKDIFKRNNFKLTKKGLNRPITAADQMNNEFNLMVGSIILGQLIDNIYNGKVDSLKWNQTNGVLRLDRIFAMYLATAWYKQNYIVQGNVDLIRTDSSKTVQQFIQVGKNNSAFWLSRVQNLIGKGGYLEISVSALS